MATYLLTWNPNRFDWKTLKKQIREVQRNGFVSTDWSVGSTKRIKPYDRLFMIRLGKEPRGIMASGWATSEWFPEPHWNPELAAEGKETISIKLEFDVLLDPDERIFPFERLSEGIYKKVWWTPQGSGKTIPEDVAEQLEKDWALFLGTPSVGPATEREPGAAAETYVEGASKQVVMSIHERNPAARRKCIERHGTSCVVCGFNFGEAFGEIADSRNCQCAVFMKHLKSVRGLYHFPLRRGGRYRS
jgi:5-methylcytosine-specific restriction protein A